MTEIQQSWAYNKKYTNKIKQSRILFNIKFHILFRDRDSIYRYYNTNQDFARVQLELVMTNLNYKDITLFHRNP